MTAPLLEGKVAIVTGAAHGIGNAIARTFVEHGARVVVADLDPERTREAADELGEAAVAVTCDVTSEDDVARVISAAQELGGPDVLVNNAGITRDASLRNMT